MTAEQTRIAILLSGFNNTGYLNIELNSLVQDLAKSEPLNDGDFTKFETTKSLTPNRLAELKMLFKTIDIDLVLGIDNSNLNNAYIKFKYTYEHLGGGANGHSTLFRTKDNGKSWEMQ